MIHIKCKMYTICAALLLLGSKIDVSFNSSLQFTGRIVSSFSNAVDITPVLGSQLLSKREVK